MLEAARDLGIDVPAELSVIGFDDIEVAAYLGLTTVRQPLVESGRRGATLLLEALARQRVEPCASCCRWSSSSAARPAPLRRRYARPMPKVEKSEQEWREELTSEQYRVLREKGTEAPFSGEYDHVFEPGSYRCAGCGAELFDSDAKYDSGCGWPAFSAPAGQETVEEESDTSHGMVRTEVLCASCGGHLGHVFPDGPNPTGLRYCINSAALKLDER